MNTQTIQVSPDVAVLAIGSPDMLRQILANVAPHLQVDAPAAANSVEVRDAYTPPPKRRGRLPGTYFVIPDVEDAETMLAQQPQSVQHVHKVLATRRRGMTAASLASVSKAPSGTVGWALAQLAKVGLVGHRLPKPVRA